MDKNIFAVPATIQKIETLSDRCLRLKVDTEKELHNDEESMIMKLRGKSGWFVFSDQEVVKEDIPDIKIDIEAGETKTQSQRLRDVLYRIWENTNRSVDWEVFYKKQTNIIIELLKEKYLR